MQPSAPIGRPATHILKSWPRLFAALADGSKRHELRPNDRGFRVGDILLLREFDPTDGTYSGRELRLEVTYVTDTDNPCALSRAALAGGYCILSVRLATPASA